MKRIEGGAEAPKGFDFVHDKEAVRLNIYHLLEKKFISYVLRKYGSNKKVSRREIYRVLGCLYSFSKPEARSFLFLLKQDFDFVRINHKTMEVVVND